MSAQFTHEFMEASHLHLQLHTRSMAMHMGASTLRMSCKTIASSTYAGINWSMHAGADAGGQT